MANFYLPKDELEKLYYIDDMGFEEIARLKHVRFTTIRRIAQEYGITKKSRAKDIVGEVFGNLTVMSRRLGENSARYSHWNCQCSCGNTCVVNSQQLRSGYYKSCGCLHANQLMGKRFGKLLVIDRIKKGGRIYWVCLCDCGGYKDVLGYRLLNGDTSACVCGDKRVVKDLVGKVFGLWTVLELYGLVGKTYRWKCRCECGTVHLVNSQVLTSGQSKSCGCRSKELGEETSMVRYGVPYPQQNTEVAMKSARTARRSYILRHWFSGEDIVCIGSYEKRVVEYFNTNHIDYLWQVQTFAMPHNENGKTHTYRPDCYLPDQDLWVEVKGYFRPHSRIKWDWFHLMYPNSELWDQPKLKSIGII